MNIEEQGEFIRLQNQTIRWGVLQSEDEKQLVWCNHKGQQVIRFIKREKHTLCKIKKP